MVQAVGDVHEPAQNKPVQKILFIIIVRFNLPITIDASPRPIIRDFKIRERGRRKVRDRRREPRSRTQREN